MWGLLSYCTHTSLLGVVDLALWVMTFDLFLPTSLSQNIGHYRAYLFRNICMCLCGVMTVDFVTYPLTYILEPKWLENLFSYIFNPSDFFHLPHSHHTTGLDVLFVCFYHKGGPLVNCLASLFFTPFDPHDALKHHITSLKTDSIFLQQRALE